MILSWPLSVNGMDQSAPGMAMTSLGGGGEQGHHEVGFLEG